MLLKLMGYLTKSNNCLMKKYIILGFFILFELKPIYSQNQSKKSKSPELQVFEPNWESLKQYDCPQWFRDAKFGIWAHWGPQSVAEFGDWYARFLYKPQTDTSAWRKNGGIKAYAHHLATYGHPSQFGYKDLIPLFKAEKFNPEELMKLYHQAGARYFMSMGQHHDNFDMWNSKYQPWNAVNMGPKKDIVKAWQIAAKNNQMKFGVSFHGQTSWSWFEASRGADIDGPYKGVPYDGNLTKADGKGKWWEGYDPQDLYGEPHEPDAPRNERFKQNFYNRTMDLIDNYKPDLIYFDGGIPFEWLQIASNFYNKSIQWNGVNQAVINVKGVAPEKQKAVVFDIENGQSGSLRKYPWQTDTSFDGWFISKTPYVTTTKKVIQQLVDIVSKNGNLMLNITQRSDGTITDTAEKFLKEMASWMAINSEAIHGTRPWEIYGEGPVKIEKGEQNKAQRLNYTKEDIRFTTKGNNLYAIIMEWPGKEITIKSLPKSKKIWFGDIKEVKLLGSSESLKWKQDESGLKVSLPENAVGKYAYTIKISGN